MLLSGNESMNEFVGGVAEEFIIVGERRPFGIGKANIHRAYACTEEIFGGTIKCKASYSVLNS